MQCRACGGEHSPIVRCNIARRSVVAAAVAAGLPVPPAPVKPARAVNEAIAALPVFSDRGRPLLVTSNKPVTSKPVTSKPVTSKPVTRLDVTVKPVTGNDVTHTSELDLLRVTLAERDAEIVSLKAEISDLTGKPKVKPSRAEYMRHRRAKGAASLNLGYI